MQIASTHNHIYMSENNVLKAYSIEDLVLIHQTSLDTTISALCCDSMAIAGTCSGTLYAIDITSAQPKVLKKFESSITALFIKGSILGIGTECGLICVVLIKDTDMVVLEERRHTAPVLGIATDGVEIYVSDMRNRICTFPDQKVYDNFNTYISYNKYLFASESSFLYCKTKEAFAVCLEHTAGNAIHKFIFNKTGSVLFIKEKKRVVVYDFNNREIINAVDIDGDFVYDEDRNRLLVQERGKFRIVDGVADKNLLKNPMESVFFKELKMEEKIVWSESECSEEVVRISRKKNKTVAYEFVGNTDSGMSDTSKENEKDRIIKAKKKEVVKARDRKGTLKFNASGGDLKRLFEDESLSEEGKDIVYAQKESISIKPTHIPSDTGSMLATFMPSSVKIKEGHLMCYNTVGYLTSTRDEFFNIVELTYHNSVRKSVRMKDTHFCTLGVFSSKAILLSTPTSLHFYSEDIEWIHKSTEDITLIGISDTLFSALYRQGVLRIYRHSGLEIFNCEFNTVQSMFCYGNSVLLLSRRSIYRIEDIKFALEKFDVLEGVDWLCESDSHIYYRANEKIYMIRNGLSLSVVHVSNVPLCVSKGYLVVLSDTNQLYPEPAVEYFKMKLEHNSAGPNILNFTILERDSDKLSNAIKEAEESGRNKLANDLKSLNDDGKGICLETKADDRAVLDDQISEDSGKSNRQAHYREKENEVWIDSNIVADMSSDNKKDVNQQVKTKRYSPFKK